MRPAGREERRRSRLNGLLPNSRAQQGRKRHEDPGKHLENDFRCIAYDHRGWGNSDGPPSGYRIEDPAYDAEGLIRKLGLRRYVLVGHSMGGKVAQLLASWHPAGLEGLLWVAPSPPVPMGFPEEQRKQMIEA